MAGVNNPGAQKVFGHALPSTIGELQAYKGEIESGLKKVTVDVHPYPNNPAVEKRTFQIQGAIEGMFRAAMAEIFKNPSVAINKKVGGYCFRAINNPGKPGSSSASNHSTGLAFDINYDVNPFKKSLSGPDTAYEMRTTGHPIVQAFEKQGFYWGGRFGDWMHFEYNGKAGTGNIGQFTGIAGASGGGGLPPGVQITTRKRKLTPEEVKSLGLDKSGGNSGSKGGGSVSTGAPANFNGGGKASPSQGSVGSVLDAKACLEFLHMYPYTDASRSIKATKPFGSKGNGTGPTNYGNLCSTFTKLAAMYGMGAFTWDQAVSCRNTADLARICPKAYPNGSNTNGFAHPPSSWYGYTVYKSWNASQVANEVHSLAKSGQVRPTDIFRVSGSNGSHVFMWGGDRWVSDFLQADKNPSGLTRDHADWYKFSGKVINMPSNFQFSDNVDGSGGGGGSKRYYQDANGDWWVEETGYYDENGNWVDYDPSMMGGGNPGFQVPQPEPITYERLVRDCPEEIQMKSTWVRYQLMIGEHSQTLHDMWYYVPQGLQGYGATAGGDGFSISGGDFSMSGDLIDQAAEFMCHEENGTSFSKPLDPKFINGYQLKGEGHKTYGFGMMYGKDANGNGFLMEQKYPNGCDEATQREIFKNLIRHELKAIENAGLSGLSNNQKVVMCHRYHAAPACFKSVAPKVLAAGGASCTADQYREIALNYMRGCKNWNLYGKGWTNGINREATLWAGGNPFAK